MDLLNFARGPALSFALVVFVLGTLWRLGGILRRPRMRDLSPPRPGAPSNLMDELIASQQIRVNKIGESVTFHDPCQIVRRGGVLEAPEALIRQVAENFIPIADQQKWNWCCGGGGGASAIHTEEAEALRAKAFGVKKRQIEETGVGTMVTFCANCRITMEEALDHYEMDRKSVV